MANSRHTTATLGPLVRLAAVILTLYFAREVLIPLALALTLSFVLTPLVGTLQGLRMHRITAVMLVMVMTLAAAGGVGWIVANQLMDVASELPKYRLNIRNKIAAIHAPESGAFGKAAQGMKEIGKELAEPDRQAGVRKPGDLPRGPAGAPTPVQVVQPPQNDLQYLRELLLRAVRPLATFGIILVFTIFILIKREDMRNRVLRLAGLSQLNVMTQALDDGAQRISRYLVMQFLVNAGYGLVFGIGLFLIGVPNAPLWGVIAAVLRIVPYVGSLMAAALPLILALAVFNGWLPPLLVFLLYAVLEGVVGNFLEPWLYGAHTGVSSLALLVTTVFWTLLWGWAGLVLSTPLSVCVIVLGRYVPEWSFLHILLGDEAPLPPHVQFYQRLLAMDQVEARAIAEEYLKGKSLVDLYDGVLAPALGLAEQNRHKGELDETREAFLFLSTNELIAELASERTAADPELPPAPAGQGRVMCIPAHDQADEITAAMLAQLLEQAGCSALAFPLDAHWDESLKQLALTAQDVVCISAVPPFAFTHARAACQRARGFLPHTRIFIGLWGYAGDVGRIQERFGHGRPDHVFTTLAEATSVIQGKPSASPAVPASATLTEASV